MKSGLLLFLTAMLLLLPALPADADEALHVQKAKLSLKGSAKPKDSVALKAWFAPALVPAGFTPGTDLLEVAIGDVTLVAFPPLPDGARLKQAKSGKWLYRAKTADGKYKLAIDLAEGMLVLKAKKLDLSSIAQAGTEDLVTRLTLGETTFSLTADFTGRGNRWSYKAGDAKPPIPPPPGGGGGGGGGGGEPPLPQTFEWRTLAQGNDSAILIPEETVARTPSQMANLWTRHGGKGPAPAIDFSKEMAVGIFIGSRQYREVFVVGAEIAPNGNLKVRYEDRPDPRQYFVPPPPWVYIIVAMTKFPGQVDFFGVVFK